MARSGGASRRRTPSRRARHDSRRHEREEWIVGRLYREQPRGAIIAAHGGRHRQAGQHKSAQREYHRGRRPSAARYSAASAAARMRSRSDRGGPPETRAPALARAEARAEVSAEHPRSRRTRRHAEAHAARKAARHHPFGEESNGGWRCRRAGRARTAAACPTAMMMVAAIGSARSRREVLPISPIKALCAIRIRAGHLQTASRGQSQCESGPMCVSLCRPSLRPRAREAGASHEATAKR